MNIKQFMVEIYEIIHVKLINTLAKRDVIFMYYMYVLYVRLKIQLHACVILLYFDYTNMDVQG